MKKLHKKTACILLIIIIMAASVFLLWQFSAPKGNNVVLIVSDALRKDMLGCYAGKAKTPNMDWLANNGVLFENAYSTAPSTIFSATSLFTGNYPTSYSSKPLAELQWDFPLIFDVEILPAELLRQTGCDVKMDIENPLIGWISQGFEKIETYDELTSDEKVYIQRLTLIKAEEACYKQMYGFLNYLLTETQDRFFVLKWILDPHSPYNPPRTFKQEIPVDWSHLPKKRRFYSGLRRITGNYNDIEKRYLTELYTKEVESVDQRLGYVLKALEYRSLLHDTYVVFTADHGELFGEHGEWSHGQNYYEEAVTIPLIIAGPGIAKGRRVSNVVSNLDIMKTLLDLLDVEFQYKSQGKSFKELLSGNPLKHLLFSINNNNFAYFVGANDRGPHQDAIRENHYKLICCKDNTYELYNLVDDPDETTNLAKNNPEVVKKCLAGLNEIRTKNTMLRESRTYVGEGTPINTELVDQLKALGYVGSQEEEEKEEHDARIGVQ